MRSRWFAIILLGVVLVAFLGFVNGTAPLLPDRVASHFNAQGRADGWMSKSGYLTFVSLMGVGLPLLIVVLSYATRFIPDWAVNLPNKDYWLAPARRAETARRLSSYSAWLCCAQTCLLGVIHALTIQANRTAEPAINTVVFLVILSLFLVAVALWVFGLYRQFNRPRPL
jgi:uncharacterized membrane protein